MTPCCDQMRVPASKAHSYSLSALHHRAEQISARSHINEAYSFWTCGNCDPKMPVIGHVDGKSDEKYQKWKE